MDYTPNQKVQAILDYFEPQNVVDASILIDNAIILAYGDKKTIKQQIIELETKTDKLKAVLL